MDELDEAQPHHRQHAYDPCGTAAARDIAVESCQREAEAGLEHQRVADMLVDIHDMLYEPVALGEGDVAAVGDVAIRAVDDELGAELVAENCDMRDAKDLEQHGLGCPLLVCRQFIGGLHVAADGRLEQNIVAVIAHP